MSIPLRRCSSSFCSLVRTSAVAATSVGPSSSPSPSSPPPAPPATLLPPRPPPSLTPLAAVGARPPATEGVCSRAFSALDLRPRFFLIGAAALTWLPLTRLMASTSTEGERAPKSADESSGGNEVWRSGCADPGPDAFEIADALRRFNAGAAVPSEVRFLLVDMVLMAGSCVRRVWWRGRAGAFGDGDGRRAAGSVGRIWAVGGAQTTANGPSFTWRATVGG